MSADRSIATVDPFDPVAHPELYHEVRRRRVLAFLIDFVLIGALAFFFGFIVLILGVITLGLGWLLFAILGPAVAILYAGFTIGSRQATWGMRAMRLTVRMWYGGRPDFWIGAAHGTLFWVSWSIIPVINLLPPLFDAKRRMLHDMVLGTVMLDEVATSAIR